MQPATKAFIVVVIILLSFAIISFTTGNSGSGPSPALSSSSSSVADSSSSPSSSSTPQRPVNPSSIAVVSVGFGLNATEQLYRRYTWAAALRYCATHGYTCVEVAPASVGDGGGGGENDGGEPGRPSGGEELEPEEVQRHKKQKAEDMKARQHQQSFRQVSDLCHSVAQTLLSNTGGRNHRYRYHKFPTPAGATSPSSPSSSSSFSHVLFIGPSAMIMNFNRTVADLLHLSPRPLLVAPEFNGNLLLVRSTIPTQMLFQGCAGGISQRSAKCNTDLQQSQTLQSFVNCALSYRVQAQVDDKFSGVFVPSREKNTKSSDDDDDDLSRRQRTSAAAARRQLPPMKRFQPGKFAATFPHCGPKLNPRGVAAKLCAAEMAEALELAVRINNVPVAIKLHREESAAAVAAEEEPRHSPSPDDLQREKIQANSSNVRQHVHHDPMSANHTGIGGDSTEQQHPDNGEAEQAAKRLRKFGFEEMGASPTPKSIQSPSLLPRATIYPDRRAPQRGPSDPPPLRIAVLSLAEYRDDVRRRNHAEELVYRTTQLSWLNKALYARKWRYDFILESGKAIDPEGKRHAAFAKLGAIEKWLRSDKYDWIWWLDADALIMNHSISIESHILERSARAKRKQLKRMQGGGGGGGGGFEHENFDFIIADDWNGINSGSFFVRKSDWSIDFFSRLNKMSINDGRCRALGLPEGWWDQSLIMCLLHPSADRSGDDASHVKQYMTQRLFNSYGPPTHMGHDDAQYHVGDFCAHFPNLKGFQRGFHHFKTMYSVGVKLNGGVPLAKASLIIPPRIFYPQSGDTLGKYLPAEYGAPVATPSPDGGFETAPTRPPTLGEQDSAFKAGMRKRASSPNPRFSRKEN